MPFVVRICSACGKRAEYYHNVWKCRKCGAAAHQRAKEALFNKDGDERAYSEEMHRQNPAPDALEPPEDHRWEDADRDSDGNPTTDEDDDTE